MFDNLTVTKEEVKKVYSYNNYGKKFEKKIIYIV